MSDIVLQKNVAALGSLRRLSDQAALTAGGSGDATTVTGITIDRQAFGNGSMPDSAELAVLFAATLASGATLSVTFDVQDSADNSSFTDYATTAAIVAATGPSGGGTVKGQVTQGFNLKGARRYVRLTYLPDLSASGTDTATVIATGFFAGFDRLPAP
jgi:hypothetical protein